MSRRKIDPARKRWIAIWYPTWHKPGEVQQIGPMFRYKSEAEAASKRWQQERSDGVHAVIAIELVETEQ